MFFKRKFENIKGLNFLLNRLKALSLKFSFHFPSYSSNSSAIEYEWIKFNKKFKFLRFLRILNKAIPNEYFTFPPSPKAECDWKLAERHELFEGKNRWKLCISKISMKKKNLPSEMYSYEHFQGGSLVDVEVMARRL